MPPEQPGLTVLDAPADEDRPPVRRRRAAAPPAAAPKKPTRKERKQRLVARKVRRVVRRLDPWSVLKVSLIFYICCYIVTMVAGVLLWNLAERAEIIDNTESFIMDLGAYQSFEFLPGRILSVALLVGGVLVIVATGLTVLGTVFFNLISDLVGGLRVVVIEEESARPRPTAAGSVPESDDTGDTPSRSGL